MIIKVIKIEEGLFDRNIKLSPNVNLIYSKQNSRGKTTLLRFILYSLGYSIPNTRNIKFEHCNVEILINTEACGDIKLIRKGNVIFVVYNDTRLSYVLPEQQNELHSLIFGTTSRNILNNLLGAFYVDQEKGWTLLNRGVVIGSVHFTIEELIRGLSGIDCEKLIKMEEKLSRELGKYRQMFSIAKYQETIETEKGHLAVDNYDEVISTELNQLQIVRNSLNRELRNLNNAIKDNKIFSKQISELKLLVKTTNNEIINVNENNIVGFNDSIEYLTAKHKLVSAQLSTVLKKINDYEMQQKKDDEQLSFWESESITQMFDRKIVSLQLNAVKISEEIKHLEKELKNIRKLISEKTRVNNDVIDSLYKNALKYIRELNVDVNPTLGISYLFTHNLKELSGAVLHKTVFAFRLAYIREIEQKIRIKLPIILDSPSGKEVDKENISLMMEILKRDFSDHQIIIASIFKYNFPAPNIIEIKNRLIE